MKRTLKKKKKVSLGGTHRNNTTNEKRLVDKLLDFRDTRLREIETTSRK